MPFKIHPAIGVARVGNSPTEWFVGPETVDEPAAPVGGYRDALCCIKRQAARFRIFEYDATGQLLGEVTLADAEITWRVTLANKKGNPIRPSARVLKGPNQSALFDDGTVRVGPTRVTVPLGEIRMEAEGTLLVLGGFGVADQLGGVWYDDTSDGIVTAEVQKDGGPVETATPAWVIVAPPDYAPAVRPCMTLYDRMLQFFMDQGFSVDVPATLSFTRHIYPILRAGADLASVDSIATFELDESTFPLSQSDRAALVSEFPVVVGGNYKVVENPQLLTETQGQWLVRWRDNVAVDEDWPAGPAPLTPAELDRGPLSHCTAFPLAPGWEAGTFIVGSATSYQSSFRFDPAQVTPGDVTKGLKNPWQDDIPHCGSYFWPAQRPVWVTEKGDTSKSVWADASPLQPARAWAAYNFVLRLASGIRAVRCEPFGSWFGDVRAYVRILFGVVDDGGGLTTGGRVPPWDPSIRLLLGALVSQLARPFRGARALALREAALERVQLLAGDELKDVGAERPTRQTRG